MSYASFERTYTTTLILPSCPATHGQPTSHLGLATALGIIQNFTTIAYLNPLIIDLVQLKPGDPHAVNVANLASQFGMALSPPYATSEFSTGHWAVTDQLTAEQQITYHCAARNTTDGMETLTDAGGSITIYGKWAVQPTHDQPGVLTLTEKSTTRAPESIIGYIETTTEASHNQLHENFKTLWRKMICGDEEVASEDHVDHEEL